MPRPKVSEAHKHEVKKAANRRYYHRHREEMLERSRARYDPEAVRYNYMINRDIIRQKDNENRRKRVQRESLTRLELLREAVLPAYQPLVEFAIAQGFHEKLFPSEISVVEALLMMATHKLAQSDETDIEMPDAIELLDAPAAEECRRPVETKQPAVEECRPALETSDPLPRLLITEVNDFRDIDLEKVLARPGSRCLSANEFLYQH
jgi:hypothetical protein